MAGTYIFKKQKIILAPKKINIKRKDHHEIKMLII